MPPLRVLISGGGIAGTSLAFWLSKNPSIHTTVVEHFPSLRTTGLQVDLRGPGIEVLRRMGLEQAFREHAAPEDGMQLIDQQGRKRAYFKANKSGKGSQSFTSEFEIMRGDLCRIIHDATDMERVKYVFGTSIADFSQSEKGVEVTFKDGKVDQFDLLIGADGVWSATRKKMLGISSKDVVDETFHPIGEYAAYMTYDQPIAKGEKYDAQMYIGTNKRSLLIRRHNEDQLQLYLLLSRPDKQLDAVRRGDVEEEKAVFAQIYADAGWKTPELLEKMHESKDFYCERLGIVKMDAWSQGAVALLGDAGYAPGGSAMGTTTAMIGAYILAGELAAITSTSTSTPHSSILVALKNYESRLRPLITQITATSGGPPDWLMPSTPWGIAVLHWVASLMAALWWDPVMNLFLKEAVSEWKLPEYEGMDLRR